MKTFASCVLNDEGDLLIHTMRPYASQVEERALEFWGEEIWAKLQELGCKIVMVEIHYEQTEETHSR